MRQRHERIIRIVEAIRKAGPLTCSGILEIGEPTADQRSHVMRDIERWEQAGWLRVLKGGDPPRYALGKLGKSPPAVSLFSRYRLTLGVDRSGVELSSEWIVMQQLKHGPLTTAEVVDLLDEHKSQAYLAIERLRRHGHVEFVNGKWRVKEGG